MRLRNNYNSVFGTDRRGRQVEDGGYRDLRDCLCDHHFRTSRKNAPFYWLNRWTGSILNGFTLKSEDFPGVTRGR